MSRGWAARRRAAGMIAAGIMSAGGAAAQAGPAAPDCAALETWAGELDLSEQVKPVEGARATMPAAFAAPGFAELFGAPALEWSSDEVEAMAAHVYDCAGEAGSREGRQAIYDLRSAMVRNLRWVVSERDKARARAERETAQAAERQAAEAARAEREAERAAERERQAAARRAQEAEQAGERQARAARQEADRLEADLERVLSRPDSVELLQILSALGDPPRDAQRIRTLRRQMDPEAGRLLALLAETDPARREAEIRPRLEARMEAAREGAAAALEAEVAGLPATRGGLDRLAEIARGARHPWFHLLGEARAQAVLEAVRTHYEEMARTFRERAKARIDSAAQGRGGAGARLTAVEQAVAGADAYVLGDEGLAEVRAHARARQAEIAAEGLEAAAGALEAEPETPEGMRRAAQAAAEAAQLQEQAEEKAREAWRGRVSARLGAIGEAALPAFREELAALPDSEAGLEALGDALPAQAGLALAPQGVRDAWGEAVAAREGEIRAALAAAREAARAEAIAAGGDPELVGHVFEDETHMSRLEFRDESLAIFTVMGLRTAGDYGVSGPDVIVEGPNGTLVLRRSGVGEALALEGMGMRFERVAR
ncbi:MAG: hypothetical protein ACQEUZ_14425 [Pseudomonadota bacterium]